MTDQTPLIPEDLINWLEQLWPEKCPRITDSERGIFYYAGSRAVVVYLATLAKEQRQEVMIDPIGLD